MPAHLVAAISAHGFGHVTQVAPVLNALAAARPGLRLTVISRVPQAQLQSRIAVPFTLVAATHDLGMEMIDALQVDKPASLAAYREFHRDYERHLQDAGDLLAALGPDAVLADIPYLTLDAAHRRGIPAIALSSLNWAEVFAHYFGKEPDAAALIGRMRGAYARAVEFLCPAPSMPMPGLPNCRAIGPIAGCGRNRRAEINRQLGLSGRERLVLLALGGLQFKFDLSNWPQDPEVHYLVPRRDRLRHPRASPFDDLEMPFLDVLASADVVLTKPGYGSFADAAANGIPVLFVTRAGWPEEPALVDWITRHARAREIPASCLATGRLQEDLAHLLAQPAPAPVPATGIAEAAASLLARLPADPAACGVPGEARSSMLK